MKKMYILQLQIISLYVDTFMRLCVYNNPHKQLTTNN